MTPKDFEKMFAQEQPHVILRATAIAAGRMGLLQVSKAMDKGSPDGKWSSVKDRSEAWSAVRDALHLAADTAARVDL